MQRHIHWAVLIVGLVLLAGCTGGNSSDTTPDNGDNGDTGMTVQNGTVTVTYSSGSFQPQQVAITQGSTVRFENQGSSAVWPASDVHPDHQQYPGGDYSQSGSYFGSQACTGENQPKDGAFDPCHRIQPGEAWSFTFNEAGTWTYHNHLAPSQTGTIVVQ